MKLRARAMSWRGRAALGFVPAALAVTYLPQEVALASPLR